MPIRQRLRRLGQFRVAEALAGHASPASSRVVAGAGIRDPSRPRRRVPPGELQDSARVDADVMGIDVARHAGRRDELDLREAAAYKQGEAVVDAGVDIEDERMRSAMGTMLPGRPAARRTVRRTGRQAVHDRLGAGPHRHRRRARLPPGTTDRDGRPGRRAVHRWAGDHHRASGAPPIAGSTRSQTTRTPVAASAARPGGSSMIEAAALDHGRRRSAHGIEEMREFEDVQRLDAIACREVACRVPCPLEQVRVGVAERAAEHVGQRPPDRRLAAAHQAD